jgi:hypothetical protein
LAWWKNECDEYDLGMMMGACVIVVMMGWMYDGRRW